MTQLIREEIWEALRSGLTQRVPGTCFAHNEAMDELSRLGTRLLPAVEIVLKSRELAIAYENEGSIRLNLRGLVGIYVRIAEEQQLDLVPLLKELTGEIQKAALGAVFSNWATGHIDRRKQIPQALFDYFCEVSGTDSRAYEVFTRYRRIGILTVV